MFRSSPGTHGDALRLDAVGSLGQGRGLSREGGLGSAAAPDSALAEAAWQLEQVPPQERRALLRDEAGLLVDRLLTRVARGQGALEVALAEGLAALASGDRLLRLGYAGVGDYARERLGLAGRTAQSLARLGRALDARPLLRAAVRRGEVSLRRAQLVLAVARGEDEAGWVERARSETTRALEEALRQPMAGDSTEADERWERLVVTLPSQAAEVLDLAFELAGQLLGSTAPRWQRLEAIAQEYLGQHSVDAAGSEVATAGVAAWGRASSCPGAHGLDAVQVPGQGMVLGWGQPERLTTPVPPWSGDLERFLEEELHRWDFLAAAEPMEAPELTALDRSLQDLDAELHHLAALRARWDELLGHLALLLRSLGLWRDMGFRSFGHYVKERLGLGTRAVEQRIALERRLHELPGLRAALRAGRLSYEQARVVARVATDRTTETWVERAAGLTCLALQRLVEADTAAQLRARGELDLRLPGAVAELLSEALQAAERVSGRWLPPAEGLVLLCGHFIATWRELPRPRRTSSQRVLERDGGWCQVPGCSRAAAHAHHLVYRSRGGGDRPENQIALCAAHHLHGVHGGRLRVEGLAPDQLTWILGEVAA